jgi:polyhydroxyalkanoate synthesis regulator phasin
LWLRAVHKLERTIGQPLEAALHSDTYFDLVTEALRMKARSDRTLESASRRVLHLLNLPAGSDIRRLREQIGRLERQVVALSKDLDDAGAR